MTAFADWLAAYATTLDDVSLERWCGAALLSRARTDLAGGVAIEVASDRAIARVGDNTVELGKGGVAASTCTCPGRICRHRVVAALALRDKLGSTRAEVSPPAPSVLDDDSARSAFGARLWKRAQTALAKGAVVELARDTSGLTAVFPGIGVSCSFPALLPIESSTCSCRAPFPCEHRAIAIAAELAPRPVERIAAEVLAPITEFCRELVEIGVDHAHAGWVRAAVRLAVLAHAAGVPALERELEELADMLELARTRSLQLELRATAILVARIAARTRALATRPATHELVGSFQRRYLDTGSVELDCIGAQRFTTADGAAGVRLHFYDGARFAVASVLLERDRAGRPWGTRRVTVERPLWGAGRWQDVLGTRLRLDNARRAADGTISATAAATVIDRCDPWRLAAIADWHTLAQRVVEAPPTRAPREHATTVTAILAPREIRDARRDPRESVVARALDDASHEIGLALPARRGNDAARRHLLALLRDPVPQRVLATIRCTSTGLVAEPIVVYRRNEPIVALGASEMAAPPAENAPSPDAPGAPLDAVWRWLEELVAAGLASTAAIAPPACPIAPLARMLDARTPDALLAAITATAITDELEARAALV